MQVNLQKFANHILFRKLLSYGKDISQGADIITGDKSPDTLIGKSK